jgi:hypothetical protein
MFWRPWPRLMEVLLLLFFRKETFPFYAKQLTHFDMSQFF